MADTKTTALTAMTTPVSTDIMYIVDDPGGSALSQKITMANLTTYFSSLTGRVLISEQTPTGTTVTWSSIPATYKSLEIEGVGRTDKAAVAQEGGYLYYNNDTTATNYSRQSTTASATTVTTGRADNSDVLVFSAATAPAGVASQVFIKIVGYAATTFNKNAQVRSSTRLSATGHQDSFQCLDWESTTAINRVDIVTDASGNFVAGTTFRLYGVF